MCINFQLDGITSVQLNKEKGFLAFLDNASKPLIVYSIPMLRFGKKTIPATMNWDSVSSECYVNLPDVSYPLSIVFGVGLQLPNVEAQGKGGLGFGFGLGFGGKGKGDREKAGTADSESDSGSDTERSKSKGFKVFNTTRAHLHALNITFTA